MPQLATPAVEVLDLRHYAAAQLRPLLHDEAQRWKRRLLWDYTDAAALLLDYLDSRVLPGYAALEPGRRGKVLGYTFAVFEAAKAVIGDVYAFRETGSLTNPICDTLLDHLIEMLQATPGVDRIESQLLMFPLGALAGPFRARGFQSFPRLFMVSDLTTAAPALPLPPGLTLEPWRPAFYDAAATLIHRAYHGHMDASINDQYRTLHGAQRFLHNIIKFPGCGSFDPAHSLLLRDPRTGHIAALVLCSRVQAGVAHITQLCVDPALRGHGLGEALLHQTCARLAAGGLHTLSLTVTEANTPALHLYQRNGFRTLHRFEAMVWEKRF